MKKTAKNKSKRQFKKIVLSVAVFAIVFVAAGAARIKAGTGDNMTGWLWGGSKDDTVGTETGAGWISMNDTNSGSGGGSYGVNLDNTTGKMSGYAWTSNLGYIDFNPQDNCNQGQGYAAASCAAPNSSDGVNANGGVKRIGNNLVGWARFVEIAKASAVGNSGGWDGWIHMNGVSINGNVLTGFAWNGETAGSANNMANGLGYIDFNGATLTSSGVTTVTLKAKDSSGNPVSTINIDNNPLPQTIYLTWTSTNASSCTASTAPDRNLWKGSKSTNSTGNGDPVVIDSSHKSETFILTCDGVQSDPVNITTGCHAKTCDSNAKCNLSTGGFDATDVSNNSTCMTLIPAGKATCATDSDCAQRSVGGWKEVAP
ncbi:MAG TPA: hypothetical protein VF817_02155 [Patescibacteria group bacterium]